VGLASRPAVLIFEEPTNKLEERGKGESLTPEPVLIDYCTEVRLFRDYSTYSSMVLRAARSPHRANLLLVLLVVLQILVRVHYAIIGVDGTVAAATMKGRDDGPVLSDDIFVDPVTGNDAADGTSPKTAVRSLHRAAEKLAGRQQLKLPSVTTTVHLAPGEYVLEETLHLKEAHGNSVWKRTDAGSEGRAVRVRGGYRMDPALFAPAWKSRDSKNIVVAPIDEDAVGDLGELQSGGLGDCYNSKAEVFVNGEPMILARYPNIREDGAWQWEPIVNVTSDDTFVFQGDRPIVYNYSAAAPDLWLHGYWFFDWADNYVRVAEVDEASQSFIIDTNTSDLMYGLAIGGRYYAVNLLQELDSPGEYFIDRERYLLYLYPPIGISLDENTEIIVSTIDTLVSAHDVSTVSLEGIDFSISRGSTLVMTNVSDFVIRGGRISNVGGEYGIEIKNSTESNLRIIGVEVSNCACRGIGVSGGDRKSLKPSGISILRNNIHDFGRWKRTYMQGILFAGCGHIVSGNVVHNAPHAGIMGHGNDCVFSYNYLHNLCYGSNDCGAFYVGRSWAERGNVIENNLFEKIRTLENTTNGYNRVQGIYLDDQESGWTITYNTFIDSDTGIQLGGGKDNVISSNMFMRVDRPLHFDKRGLSWNSASCVSGGMYEKELNLYNYTQPPWSDHYNLSSIFSNRPCAPTNNVVEDFRFCKSDALWIFSPDSEVAELLLWNNSFANIVKDDSLCEPSMIDPLLRAWDYAFHCVGDEGCLEVSESSASASITLL